MNKRKLVTDRRPGWQGPYGAVDMNVKYETKMNENVDRILKEVWPDPEIDHTRHLKLVDLLIKEFLQIAYMNNNSGEGGEIIKITKKHFGLNNES